MHCIVLFFPCVCERVYVFLLILVSLLLDVCVWVFGLLYWTFDFFWVVYVINTFQVANLLLSGYEPKFRCYGPL